MLSVPSDSGDDRAETVDSDAAPALSGGEGLVASVPAWVVPGNVDGPGDAGESLGDDEDEDSA